MNVSVAELEAVARELEAALSPEDLAKARLQMRMSVISAAVELGVVAFLVLLWLPTGWAVALRDALHANAAWWRTYLAVLAFSAVGALVSLPFSWYFGYRLDTRLGLNRQSLADWLVDKIKGWAVGLPLQGLLWLGAYLVFRRWPQRWFVGLVVVVVAFLIVFYLAQPLLMRLRYKTEPLDDPDLRERLGRLFQRAGVPFGGLSVLKAGEKTGRAGAALMPRGSGTEVVLFDTLLESMSPEEVEVVVAHELGHKVHRDMLKLMSLLGVLFVLALAGGYAALQTLGRWDGLGGPGDVATFPLLELVVTLLFLVLQVALNGYTRREERAADAFALRMTDNPAAFERVMVALTRQNKTLPLEPRWVEFLFSNHPSMAERVLMARRWAQKRQGG